MGQGAQLEQQTSLMITEHRTQNTEYRAQSTEHNTEHTSKHHLDHQAGRHITLPSMRSLAVLDRQTATGGLVPNVTCSREVLELELLQRVRCVTRLRKNGLFLSFPYVCPEPVLVA